MFTTGRPYIRREIHRRLSGQAQGGKSTPTQHPVVLIFTGSQGEQYGYIDGWTDDGVFLYTGEGQHGDMEFIRGNKAIRNHIHEGKELHLFEYVAQGTVRYRGQMVYIGYERREGPDVDGTLRSAIVFELLPLEAFDDSDFEPVKLGEGMADASLDELWRRAIEDSHDPRPPRESVQAAHYRSSAVRDYVLGRASGVCEACGDTAPFVTKTGRPYLEPHHIRRVSDGGPDHPDWVAGVCPNCHGRAHYSADKDDFNARLRATILEKEQDLLHDA